MKKVRLKNLTFLLPIQLQPYAHLVDGDGPMHLRLGPEGDAVTGVEVLEVLRLEVGDGVL